MVGSIANRVRSTFGIRLPLLMGAIGERVPAVMTSVVSPRVHTRMRQDAGIAVARVVTGIAHAEKAAEAGADALIAEPTESGGHRGANEIAMTVLDRLRADLRD